MYLWIITLTWDAGDRAVTQSANGTAPVEGRSRAEIYEQVLAYARREMGAPGNAAVVFFSLEPEDL